MSNIKKLIREITKQAREEWKKYSAVEKADAAMATFAFGPAVVGQYLSVGAACAIAGDPSKYNIITALRWAAAFISIPVTIIPMLILVPITVVNTILSLPYWAIRPFISDIVKWRSSKKK